MRSSPNAHRISNRYASFVTATVLSQMRVNPHRTTTNLRFKHVCWLVSFASLVYVMLIGTLASEACRFELTSKAA